MSADGVHHIHTHRADQYSHGLIIKPPDAHSQKGCKVIVAKCAGTSMHHLHNTSQPLPFLLVHINKYAEKFGHLFGIRPIIIIF